MTKVREPFSEHLKGRISRPGMAGLIQPRTPSGRSAVTWRSWAGEVRVGLGRVYTLRVGTTPWPRLAAGESVDSHHVELATELVVRQSTARPPVSAAAAPTPKVR